ncbi:WXG100 family type VII secretion target [Kitasatospora sp. NPDC096147]|uniref:WXG100 family type VII secretion target n=1 Tax=Kitasatospora sp. NPDC096147 TaxID=3364093 RepID=UPI0037F84A0E
MGSQFKVETGRLDQLINDLHRSQDEMRTALNAMRDTGPKTTGSKALDHACDEFHDSWDDAIKKIADGTQQIEEGLKITKQAYEETEQAIRDALTGGK